MLNPCHDPYSTLNKIKEMCVNFASGEEVELTCQVIDSYQGVPIIDCSMILPRWIMLNMDDEVLNANETLALYNNSLEVITFECGGHRFENIGSSEVIAQLERINNSYFIHSVADA